MSTGLFGYETYLSYNFHLSNQVFRYECVRNIVFFQLYVDTNFCPFFVQLIGNIQTLSYNGCIQ